LRCIHAFTTARVIPAKLKFSRVRNQLLMPRSTRISLRAAWRSAGMTRLGR
jgi:hypothetical protein